MPSWQWLLYSLYTGSGTATQREKYLDDFCKEIEFERTHPPVMSQLSILTDIIVTILDHVNVMLLYKQCLYVGIHSLLPFIYPWLHGYLNVAGGCSDDEARDFLDFNIVGILEFHVLVQESEHWVVVGCTTFI